MGHKVSKMSVVISPESEHTASVIFLHGIGDTGHKMAEFSEVIKLPHIKYICPTASSRRITVYLGCRMSAWFDVKSLNPEDPEDEEGIERASEAILKMVDDEEENGIPAERIALGGFSQGGALALYSAVRSSKPLGGVVALSGWVPVHRQFPYGVGQSFKRETPLLQCHGELDKLLEISAGIKSHELLKKVFTNAEFKTYKDLDHSVSGEEMEDVKAFLSRVLP